MEYLVLHSYMNFGKQIDKGWKNFFKELGIKKTILLLILLVSTCSSFVFSFLYNKYPKIFYISILAEIIIGIFMSIFEQREVYINSNTDLKRQNERYDEVKKWLGSIGFKEKNQIKQLCRRCEYEVKNYRDKDDKRKKFIDKVFSFFLIPIFAAFISWILGEKNNFSIQMILVIEIGGIGIALYIFVHYILFILSPILDREYIQMCKLIKDIQGVLDRKFIISNEDII